MTTDEALDPNFCVFCQDAIHEGTMLVVLAGTQDVIFNLELGACSRCGRIYTDTQICEYEEDGRIGLLQFEHARFKDQDIQSRIVPLTEKLQALTCMVCGELLNDTPEPLIPPQVLATKMLRMSPGSEEISGACESCSRLGLCPCCNDSHDED